LKQSASLVNYLKAVQALATARSNGDKQAIEAASTAYQTADEAYSKARRNEDDREVREALRSVEFDAKADHPNAIADAAAADMAASDAQQQLISQGIITASEEWCGSRFQPFYQKYSDVVDITNPVQQAYYHCAKGPVIKALFVPALKASPNKNLKVHRVTTSGEGILCKCKVNWKVSMSSSRRLCLKALFIRIGATRSNFLT